MELQYFSLKDSGMSSVLCHWPLPTFIIDSIKDLTFGWYKCNSITLWFHKWKNPLCSLQSFPKEAVFALSVGWFIRVTQDRWMNEFLGGIHIKGEILMMFCLFCFLSLWDFSILSLISLQIFNEGKHFFFFNPVYLACSQWAWQFSADPNKNPDLASLWNDHQCAAVHAGMNRVSQTCIWF